VRRRRAFWVASAGPLTYLVLPVFSPGYRVEEPLAQAAIVSAVVAAGCCVALALQRGTRRSAPN
jgi:hypothetical protein